MRYLVLLCNIFANNSWNQNERIEQLGKGIFIKLFTIIQLGRDPSDFPDLKVPMAILVLVMLVVLDKEVLVFKKKHLIESMDAVRGIK